MLFGEREAAQAARSRGKGGVRASGAPERPRRPPALAWRPSDMVASCTPPPSTWAALRPTPSATGPAERLFGLPAELAATAECRAASVGRGGRHPSTAGGCLPNGPGPHGSLCGACVFHRPAHLSHIASKPSEVPQEHPCASAHTELRSQPVCRPDTEPRCACHMADTIQYAIDCRGPTVCPCRRSPPPPAATGACCRRARPTPKQPPALVGGGRKQQWQQQQQQ